MPLSTHGARFIRLQEGFAGQWFVDAEGVARIGCRFSWHSQSFRSWWKTNRPRELFVQGATMSREEADECLALICASEIEPFLLRFLQRPIEQHVLDAAISVIYDFGPMTLHAPWARALKAGDYSAAAEYLLETETRYDGKLVPGILPRRRAEARLLLDAVYEDVAELPAEAEEEMRRGGLVRRDRGKAVEQLQTELAEAGRYTGAIDGVYGAGTEAANRAAEPAAGDMI